VNEGAEFRFGHPGVLEKLVVGGSPAEATGKVLLEDPHDVRLEESHPTGRELLEASDRIQTSRPAEPVGIHGAG
jgi:hypothetical protein